MSLPPSCLGRDQDTRRTHHRIDDIAFAQRELLDHAVDQGMNDGLVEIDLGLGARSFGAALLRRQKQRDLGLNGLLIGNGGRERTLPGRDDILEPFDFPLRHGRSIAPLQLALGLQLVDRLLIGALRLLDLSIGRFQLDLRLLRRCVDLGDPTPGSLQRRLLFRAVELEDRLTRFDLVAEIHINLFDPTTRFR